jgi:hypothetical protein
MADALLYEQSLETQGDSSPFISRQVVQVLDQNGGNYNGQIQIDTSSLSNSGKYASYGEAYLCIPLVTVLEATSANSKTGLNAATIPFGVGFKCGFHQLIHSLSVSYNNSDVVQLTPFTNFYVQYKLMTHCSWDDVKKIGPSIGFYPDSSQSYSFVTAAASVTDDMSGIGLSNNKNWYGDNTATGLSTYALYQKYAKYNEGFLKRQEDTALTYGVAPHNNFFANATDVGINYYETATDYKVWYTMAKIRLKDLHSFFEQLPLVKGAFLSLRLNCNTCTHTLSSLPSSGGTVSNLYTTGFTTNGGTSPLLVASGGTTSALGKENGLGTLHTAMTALTSATIGTFSLRVSIGKDTGKNLTHPTWQAQTRLFVPLYQMTPTDEERYLSLNRVKKIVYEDIYSYQTNVALVSTSC